MATVANHIFTYNERLQHLKATKLRQTAEKREVFGVMDYDELPIILPPVDKREIVEIMGGSGVLIKDSLIKGYVPESNHPSGGFFGPEIVGKNFRSLLEMHPIYIDPMCSLAGAYMTNFIAYRQPHWNPEYSYDHLKLAEEQYGLFMGVGGMQHFCQDLNIGLTLGWDGILQKIRKYSAVAEEEKIPFYTGLEHVVKGIQIWIKRSADESQLMAESEQDPILRQNLEDLADMNSRLTTEPPQTFREACQWILWFLLSAHMYNGSGSGGAFDQLLLPYYERDVEKGILSDEEAVFHMACLILKDTSYQQLGGYDSFGNDTTNKLSYLMLEASDRLKLPSNIGVCVGKGIDRGLLKKSVDMIMRNKNGVPKFLGIDQTSKGFTKNGYSLELGNQRIYSGCHWVSLQGREYTMNDIIKINLGKIFEIAFDEMMNSSDQPGLDVLWIKYEQHLDIAVTAVAEAVQLHLKYMHKVYPELVMDLLCHGPIEKGLDATAGGVEFYNIGVDAAAFATVADSFAALEQRVELDKRFGWREIYALVNSNWKGEAGKKARLIMKNSARFGTGGSLADSYASRISASFSRIVKKAPVSGAFIMIPGIFSWALVHVMGEKLGATPNGRYAGDPISQGANPHPGFRKDGAATALACAVASIQPGYGNTAPLQIDLDPSFNNEEGKKVVESLIATHFDMGGTQINMNIVDAEQIIEAHKNPELYPDLVVRVTGFSAYFANLSQELRQFVVDRIIQEN